MVWQYDHIIWMRVITPQIAQNACSNTLSHKFKYKTAKCCNTSHSKVTTTNVVFLHFIGEVFYQWLLKKDEKANISPKIKIHPLKKEEAVNALRINTRKGFYTKNVTKARSPTFVVPQDFHQVHPPQMKLRIK